MSSIDTPPQRSPSGDRRVRRTAAAAMAAGLLVLTSAALAAHDFWIIPNAFAIDANGSVEVRGQTSVKFPTSGGRHGDE